MSAFGDWGTGLAEWQIGKVAYLSVVFSWQLQIAYQRAVWLRQQGFYVRAGGPAVDLNPNAMRGVAVTMGKVNALPYHNPNATFTSRGCIRKCPFCAVPRIEGDLVELANWEAKPIVCDNNLLACSRAHFDKVIDRLKPIPDVDFNQGLDARLLTDYHANRLAELDLKVVRLAWDDTRNEKRFLKAFQCFESAGFAVKRIRVYVLIGFNDTPADALYRLETIRSLGAWPNPMRYQPLDTPQRNSYVAPGWTDRELKRFTRYWSRLAWLEHIPFVDYHR